MFLEMIARAAPNFTGSLRNSRLSHRSIVRRLPKNFHRPGRKLESRVRNGDTGKSLWQNGTNCTGNRKLIAPAFLREGNLR